MRRPHRLPRSQMAHTTLTDAPCHGGLGKVASLRPSFSPTERRWSLLALQSGERVRQAGPGKHSDPSPARTPAQTPAQSGNVTVRHCGRCPPAPALRPGPCVCRRLAPSQGPAPNCSQALASPHLLRPAAAPREATGNPAPGQHPPSEPDPTARGLPLPASRRAPRASVYLCPPLPRVAPSSSREAQDRTLPSLSPLPSAPSRR